MKENFDDIIIPGPAEVPPSSEVEKNPAVAEAMAGKPEVVLLPEDRERILTEKLI